MTIDEPASRNGRSAQDMRRRDELVIQVNEVLAERGWSKAEGVRRSGIGHGTFTQWLNGNYSGRIDNVNASVATWLGNLDQVDEVNASVPVGPGYVELGVAVQIERVISIAQIMGTFCMVTAEAGCGKTTAAAEYVRTHANSYMVTMSPDTRAIHTMMSEIADTIGVEEKSSNRLRRAVAKRLQRTGDGTVLLIDEAQNLSDDAINQLRYFSDTPSCRCGIVVLGNSATSERFGQWAKGEKYSQLNSRVFRRLRIERPTEADLAALIDAWGITEPSQVQYLMGVGMKPGAMRQIDMTVKLGRMLAQSSGHELTLADLRAAWANRDVELV